MSSATVRSALYAFFNAPPIAGINKLHAAPPYWADGSEWDLSVDLGSGAIGAIHLAEDVESRITVPAPNVLLPGNAVGQKIVTYTVGFMIFYQYLLPSNTLTPVDPADWANPLDSIIDGIKARIRSDPTGGNSSVVWELGQQPGYPKVVRDLPRLLPGKVLSWNVVEFQVDEVITD